MKKFKRSLSLFLAVLITLNIFAVSSFAVGSANYTALDAAIADVPAQTATYYRPHLWKTYASALAAAKSVERTLTSEYQSTIDSLTANLTSAKATLGDASSKLLETDPYYSLWNTVYPLENINRKLYTPSSLAVLDAALAQIVWEGKSSSVTNGEYLPAVQAAYSSLVLAADYTLLDAKIAEAEVILAYPTTYITSNRSQLNYQLNSKAKKVSRDLTQAEQSVVDAAARELQDSINLVTFKNASFSALETAIINAKSKTPSHYENYNLVEVVLQKTQKWFNSNGTVKPGFDIRDQAEIDAVTSELNNAVAALVRLPADYTALDAAIAAVPSEEELVYYLDDIVAALLGAVAEAEQYRGLYKDSQSIIDQKTANIVYYTTQLNINLKPADYSGVDAAIAKQPDDLSIYTADTILALNLAVQQVDRTKNIKQQAEVDAMEQRILDAIEALEIYKEPTMFEKILRFIVKLITDVIKWLTNVAVPKIKELIDKNKD